MTHAECLARTLREHPDLLLRVAEFLISDALEDEDSWEIAEEVCVVAFGERVHCPCGVLVLPGFLCWDCEEWTAPSVQERQG